MKIMSSLERGYKTQRVLKIGRSCKIYASAEGRTDLRESRPVLVRVRILQSCYGIYFFGTRLKAPGKLFE